MSEIATAKIELVDTVEIAPQPTAALSYALEVGTIKISSSVKCPAVRLLSFVRSLPRGVIGWLR